MSETQLPPAAEDLKAKLAREGSFWDAASGTTVQRDLDLYRVAAADREDRCLPWFRHVGLVSYLECVLGHLGQLQGRRILDLGCGSGFLATLLAANGAIVDAVDVSEKSLEVARLRAEISGVADRVRFHCGPAETLNFPDASFDAACGMFVLHHLDLSLAAPELCRVMRPGAPAAFIETSAGSRLLMAARRMIPGRMGITKSSSPDEAPLGPAALAMLGEQFGPSVQLLSPETLFFRMLSYVPPLHRRPARLVLGGMDRALHLLRPCRQWSYYKVVRIVRPGR
jgi:SAM-dependent methyltransferase